MSKKSLSNDALKVVIGLSLILLAITALINRNFFGGGIAYVFGWAFGFVGYWFIFPLIGLIGVYLCFYNRLRKINFHISLIGFAILIFSLLIVFTNLGLSSSGSEVPYFDTFINIFSTYFKANEFPFNQLEVRMGGGAIGYFLTGALNSIITPTVTDIVGFVVGGVGVLFMCNYLFVLLFRTLKHHTQSKKDEKNNKYRYFDDNRIFDTSEIENIMSKNTKDFSRISTLHSKVEQEEKYEEPAIKEEVPIKQPEIKNTSYENNTMNLHNRNSTIKKAIFIDDEESSNNPKNSNKELIKPLLDIDLSNNIAKTEIENHVDVMAEDVEDNSEEILEEIKSNRIETIENRETAIQESAPSTIVEKVETTIELDNNDQAIELDEEPIELVSEKKIEPYVPPVSTTIEEEDEEEEEEEEIVEEDDEEEIVYEEKDGIIYRPQPKLKEKTEFIFPSEDLLDEPVVEDNYEENERNCQANVEKINTVFKNMHIGAEVVGFTIGPSVTQYDVFTDENTPVEQILKAEKTICVRLNGKKVTINTIVEGKATSEILVPNEKRTTVYFKEAFKALPPISKSSFYIPFGKNISGEFKAAKIINFPHMLIAGTSGSGKSVYVNSILLSLIMRNSPDTLRLILIDPKRVEFAPYREIPHLLCPVITDSKKADLVLNKLSEEMERRYTLFEVTTTSDIESFNDYAEEQGLEKLPYIVLVTDEFGDLVDTNKKVGEFITKLAAKARAAGIHLIIATQRPSVDVISGTIKANLNTRVCLSVSKTQDSQVILGCGGAESLLGNGDMIVDCGLISRNGFVRAQGCFVNKNEVKAVCKYYRDNYKVHYDPFFTKLKAPEEEKPRQEVPVLSLQEQRAKSDDELYNQIKDDVMRQQYTSVSKIQRDYQIGFNRAGKMANRLLSEGIIGEAESQSSNKGFPVIKRFDSTPSAGPGSIESSEVE